MATLDLTPRQLNLKLIYGDDPLITLRFWTDDTKTELLDLTGYTGWTATIRTAAGDTATFAIDDDRQLTASEIDLLLDGEDVRDFPSKRTFWDCKAVLPDAREVTLYQGRVTFKADQSQ